MVPEKQKTKTQIFFEQIRNGEHNLFERFIFVVIIFSAILIGVETDRDILNNYRSVFHYIDLTILLIFIAEVIIKLIAEGKQPWNYFKNGWNLFDLFIVIVSTVPFFFTHGGEESLILLEFRLIRLARSFRILRLTKIAEHIRPLRLLIETVIKSLPSLLYVIIMLMVLFYIYAIIGYTIFHNYSQTYFGDLGKSFISLFESTAGNWPSIMDSIQSGTEKVIINGKEIIRTFDLPYIIPIYFISFYFLAGLIILNLFVGVIVSELSDMKELRRNEALIKGIQDELENDSIKLIESISQQIHTLNKTFVELQKSLDTNKSGGTL